MTKRVKIRTKEPQAEEPKKEEKEKHREKSKEKEQRKEEKEEDHGKLKKMIRKDSKEGSTIYKHKSSRKDEDRKRRKEKRERSRERKRDRKDRSGHKKNKTSKRSHKRNRKRSPESDQRRRRDSSSERKKRVPHRNPTKISLDDLRKESSPVAHKLIKRKKSREMDKERGIQGTNRLVLKTEKTGKPRILTSNRDSRLVEEQPSRKSWRHSAGDKHSKVRTVELGDRDTVDIRQRI